MPGDLQLVTILYTLRVRRFDDISRTLLFYADEAMAPRRTKRRNIETLIAEPTDPEEHLVQLKPAEVASSVAQGSNFPSLSVFPLELLLEVC